jgi:2'-5' RNA ligase
VRTFIAIDLDGGLKDKLEALVGEFSRLADNVRWVRPAGMHLTLKFMGETPDHKASAMAEALRALSGRHKSFPMRLRGLGFFPPGRSQPRVIWVGIESGPELGLLQREIEAAAEKLGYEREKREFHPHLTLGRVKFPGRMDRVLGEIEKRRDEDFGEMSTARLTFFRSVLKPEGAEYSVLEEFRLA